MSTSVRASRVLPFVLLFASSVHAGPAYTDPEKADDDYALQGEFAGEFQGGDSPGKVGIQVIALGDGKFQAVGYRGGLPGDHWDKSDRPTADGTRVDDRVVFRGDHGTAELVGDELTIMTPDGTVLGKTKRVHRKSPTLGEKPPEGAIVLFDGTSVEAWKDGKMTDDGLLIQGTSSKQTFGSHRLHIEFRLPYMPEDRGQQRGNSGLYLQSRYEVQMLDSFGLEGKDNECGGIYSIKAPDLNMCYPPLTWQTYDVEFHAAKYNDDGSVDQHPWITVKHNGVLIHDHVELPKSTTAAPLGPGPEPGPVYLQNHGNPVRYRNIWVVPID